MHIIVETFRHNPLARVSTPSMEEIKSLKAAFAEQHLLLNDCWATMDGLKLYLQTARNAYIQERFIMDGSMITMLHPSSAFVPMA